MPMPKHPGNKSSSSQIKFACSVLDDKTVFVRTVIVIEYHYLFIRAYLRKVIGKPTPYVPSLISCGIISLCDCGDNVMDVAHVKRIIDGTVSTFKQIFAILAPLDVIVIAYDVSYRHSHILGIHILNMLFESVLIANVARVYDKSRVLVLCGIAHFVHPCACALGVYFRIRDLQKAVVCQIFFLFIEIKIITFLCPRRLYVIIFRPISAGYRDRDKPSLIPTVDDKTTLLVSLDYVVSVGDGYACKRRICACFIDVSAESVAVNSIINAECKAAYYDRRYYDYNCDHQRISCFTLHILLTYLASHISTSFVVSLLL